MAAKMSRTIAAMRSMVSSLKRTDFKDDAESKKRAEG
jgi:hypothetical protein